MLNPADLEARVARLESRNYVSMRYGRVTGTKDGEAQIQLNDADELNTNSYQTLQRRVLRDQEIKLPDIGDTALVLESGQGEELGPILARLILRPFPAPARNSRSPTINTKTARNSGTTERAHTLTAKVNGNVSVEAREMVSVSSETGIRLRAPFIGLAVL